jgi:hypothetical protein
MRLFFRPGEPERGDRGLTFLPRRDDLGFRWNRLAQIALPKLQSLGRALLRKCGSCGEGESDKGSVSQL